MHEDLIRRMREAAATMETNGARANGKLMRDGADALEALAGKVEHPTVFAKPDRRTTPASGSGHGHVVPRPDGVKARCGGPAICPTCALEQARLDSPNGRLHVSLHQPPSALGAVHVGDRLLVTDGTDEWPAVVVARMAHQAEGEPVVAVSVVPEVDPAREVRITIPDPRRRA